MWSYQLLFVFINDWLNFGSPKLAWPSRCLPMLKIGASTPSEKKIGILLYFPFLVGIVRVLVFKAFSDCVI